MSLNHRSQRVNKPLFIFCLIVILLVGVAFSLASARKVRADTYTVCAAGCDFTTIQAAIDDATITAGDVINVADAIHTEAGITVNKDVTIQGQGAVSTTVQAHTVAKGADDRVFFIDKDVTVTIKGVTIRHGNPTSEPESGGGILNEGVLTLEDSVVSDNSASAGGGILNDGTLTLVNCTVRDNQARGGGDSDIEGSAGGGIKNMEGTFNLIDSTVSGNTAEGKGGGIHVARKGTLVLVNSTISGNRTNDDGGGIYLDGVGKFDHGTISDNEANTGGGLYISGSPEKGVTYGLLDYTNTIIANNTARMEEYGVADCVLGDYGSIGANSHNLVEDKNCSPKYFDDPRLAALADNGGDTQTHALLPGSQAIDAIPAGECTADTDQRGISRPQVIGCDVGAVEWRPSEVGALDSAKCTGWLVVLLILIVVGLVTAWRRQRSILFLCIIFLTGCGRVMPAPSSDWPTGGWQTSTPEEQGMDSEMLAAMLDTIWEQGYDIDSVSIVRNGYMVVDAYVHPFRSRAKHVTHSCTKSIISALVGIAIDEGYIKSVQQPILDFFPERTVANLDASKKGMTLEHVLTMSSGLDCRDSYLHRWRGLEQMRQSEDWVQFMLDLPMAEKPGTRFEYCNGASFLLSAILQETTGVSALEFAEEHLFAPLGISDVSWPSNPQGITIGWSDLRMKPHDMAKIGYLYLNEGVWDGEQVVPSSWVEASTRAHISATLQDGYGYQWWVDSTGVYMALGYAGQFIFVVPEQDMVVVFTSDLVENDFYTPQILLNEFIIPAAQSSTPLPDNPDGTALLESRIQALANP